VSVLGASNIYQGMLTGGDVARFVVIPFNFVVGRQNGISHHRTKPSGLPEICMNLNYMCPVYMNNGCPPAPLRAEGNQCCENVVTVLLGIKCHVFRKSLKHVKCQQMSCNRHDDFLVLNRVLRPFRRSLVRSKPDPLVICGKTEPRLIKSDSQLSTLMVERMELAQ
jgi:hypothetical protein